MTCSCSFLRRIAEIEGRFRISEGLYTPDVHEVHAVHDVHAVFLNFCGDFVAPPLVLLAGHGH